MKRLYAAACAFVLAAGRENILNAAFSLFGAVLTLHLFGFAFGYALSKFLLKKEDVARTISIEVGMQNSGLAVALANLHFSALTALPPAIASVCQNITGSLLAWWWRRN